MSEDWSGTEDVSKTTIYENAIVGARRKSSSQSSAELNRSRSPLNEEKYDSKQLASDKEKSAATVSNVREMVGRQRRLSRQNNLTEGDNLVMQEVTNIPVAPKRRLVIVSHWVYEALKLEKITVFLYQKETCQFSGVKVLDFTCCCKNKY